MKLKKKFLMGILLTLTLTLILGNNAFATPSSDKISLMLGDNAESGTGYDYTVDGSTGTLTLDGYIGVEGYGGIRLRKNSTEIVLNNGTVNTLSLTEPNGANSTEGICADDLTISGNGTLNINIDVSGKSSTDGVFGINAGNLIIKDGAIVNISIISGSKSNGILTWGSTTIKNSAALDIDIETSNYGYGISSNKGIKVQDTATFDISVEISANASYGLFAQAGEVNISSTGNQVITMAGDNLPHTAIYNRGYDGVANRNEIVISGANLVITFPTGSYGTGIENSNLNVGKIEILNGAEVTINNGWYGIFDATSDGTATGVKIEDSTLDVSNIRYNGIYVGNNGLNIIDSDVTITSTSTDYVPIYLTGSSSTKSKVDISGSSIVTLHSENSSAYGVQTAHSTDGGPISEVNLTGSGIVTITNASLDAVRLWDGFVKLSSTTKLKEGSTDGEGELPAIAGYEDVEIYAGDETTKKLIFVAQDGFDVKAPTFTDEAEGYASISEKSISISAIGGDRTIQSVTIDDDTHFELSNASSVEGITITSGTKNELVTIRPKDDLQYGTYIALITVTDTDDNEFTATVTFKITSPVRVNIASANDYGKNIEIRAETIFTLTDDITFTNSNSGTLELYADLTIDLNGHTISLEGRGLTFLYKSDCTVKIIDSSAEKNGKIVWTEGSSNEIKIFHYNADCEANLIIDGIKYEYPSNFYYRGVIRSETAGENKTFNILVKNSLFKIKGPLFDMNNIGDYLDYFTLKFEDTIIEKAEASADCGFVLNDTGLKYKDLIDTAKYVILGDGIAFDNNALVESYGTSFDRFEVKKRDGFEITAPTFDEVNYGYAPVTAKDIEITAIGSNRSISTVTVDGTEFEVSAGTPGEVLQDATNSTYKIAPKINLSAGTHTATITVTDTASPANTYTASVTFIVNKITPSYTAPIGLTATYGDTLGDVLLDAGTDPGVWSWKEATTTKVGDVGDRTHTAVYTPIDSVNFKTVEDSLTISVGKAGQVFATASENKTIKYGETLDYPFTLSKGDGSISYSTGDATYVSVDTNGRLTANKVTASPITITVTAAATDNCNEATTTYTVTVTKVKLQKPTATTTSFGFTNSTVGPDVSNVDLDKMTKSGDDSAQYVGSYSAIYSLKDTTNYCWLEDDSIGNITISWSITPATSTLSEVNATNYQLVKGQSVDLNTLVLLSPSEYSDDVTFSLVGTPSGITLSGDMLSALVDTGVSSVTIKANFAGKNLGGSSDLDYSASAELEFAVDIVEKTEVTLGGLTYANKTYDGTVVTPTGDLTFTVSDAPVASLTMADVDVSYVGRDGTTYGPSSVSPVNSGKYTVTYTIKNTNASYTGTVSYNFEIAKVQIIKPTLEQTTFYYTGEAIDVPVTNEPSSDLVTFWTTSTNDVFDNLKFRFEINDTINYEWVGGTTTDVELFFDIKPTQSVITKKVESPELKQGSEVNLRELINLVPAKCIEDVVFTTDDSLDGVTLEGNILKATSSAETGFFTIKANFAGFNDDLDATLEYLAATELSFQVEIIRRSTSSGGSSGGSSEALPKYEIKVTSGRGGKVSPSTLKVEKGDDQKFTISANDGYEIDDVVVDGKSVGAVKKYTFENVKKKHTIEATFKKVEKVPEVNEPEIVKPEVKFNDVSDGAWYVKPISYVVENGLMSGVGDGNFAPSDKTTRAMVVTILFNKEGRPLVNLDAGFIDVVVDSWYEAPVSWASGNDIVKGVGDGNFAPNGFVTREQLAVILYNYAKSKGIVESTGVGLGFNDATSISPWALEAINWCVENGIMSGKGNNMLDPLGFATRAEVATMIMNFIEM